MIGEGDAGDLFVGELAVGAVDHAAELAGVDEQHLAAAVTETSTRTQALPQGRGRRLSGLVARQEPQAVGDLRGVEELARQRHHAIYQVRLDDVPADLAL